VALVRERTTPTERPPPVGEVKHKLLNVLIYSILKISKKALYKIYIHIGATLRHDKFLSCEIKSFGWTDFWELNPETLYPL